MARKKKKEEDEIKPKPLPKQSFATRETLEKVAQQNLLASEVGPQITPLPPEEPEIKPEEPAAPAPSKEPAVFRNPKTGRISGVAIGGRTLLGLSPEEVEKVVAGEARRTGTPMSIAGIEAQAKARLAGAEQRPALEQAGAFEEVTPREVGLDPSTGLPVKPPVLGVGGEAFVASILNNALVKGWIDDQFGKGRGVVTGEEAFPIPLTPETLREASLRQISQNSFSEGISVSESFGSMIEAIPLVGKAASSWASGLTETPSKNANNVIAEINKIKEAASTGQEKVRNGLESPEFGIDRARSMEEDIAALEGRLKLLIETSAILRANTDNVNKIQEEILEAREKVNRYRIASTFGLTAQLTGTGTPPATDEAMFFELKEFNERG